MQGVDGCERMVLDDKLAIALNVNTAKQVNTTFVKKTRTLQIFVMNKADPTNCCNR